MARSAFILLLVLVSAVSSPGQVKVIDASRLQGNYPFRYIPDVDGKVAVSESLLNYFSPEDIQNYITVFPSWPINKAGSNERGAIFGNLDADPQMEIVYPVGPALYAFNMDGSDADGWPRLLDYPTDGAPAFGDIDGDGEGEIVVTTHEPSTFNFGLVWAFNADGTNVTGFPVLTIGGGVRSPVLADLDDDGADEIVIAMRDWPEGLIYVYRGDGSLFPGWPVRMDYIPGSDVAVGDIDGDDIPEIVAESYYRLHAYRTDGVIVQGFPYLPGQDRVFSYSTPVLADLDGDGRREIICGDHSIVDGSGAVHVVKYNGTAMANWPNYTDSWIYGPPSIGDINGDGVLDVIIGDQSLSTTPANKIYGWDAVTAYSLPGFPITNVFGVNSQILLADLDGDGEIELMADDNTSDGKYAGYNNDGTVMEGWPLVVSGSTYFINPLVADINLDGMMAISGGGYDQASSSTNLYMWNANVEYNADLAVLPVLQYNTRHTGVYGDTFMVGTPEVPSEAASGWQVYPNPATTGITLSRTGQNRDAGLQVSIYQSSGKKVFEQDYNTSSSDFHFDLTGYHSGIYLIAVKSGRSATAVVKFIVTSSRVSR